MGTFAKPNTLQLLYCQPSAEKERLSSEIAGMAGLDAEVHILERKRARQSGTIDSRIYTLVAGTGAGKTTFMVYGLYKRMILKKYGRKTLLCTQPKVGLASTQPYNLEQMFADVKVGKELGFATGSGGRLQPQAEKAIVYCTTQILANYILSTEPDKFGTRFPIIVIDEAHDESIEMLTTLRTVREYIHRHYERPWCPLFIITSATIDPLAYVAYFGGDPDSPYNSAFISGRSGFPLDEKYIDPADIRKLEGKIIPIAVEEACRAVGEIVRQAAPQPTHTDILAFWTSAKEISKFLAEAEKAISETMSHSIQAAGEASQTEEREDAEASGESAIEDADGKWTVLYLSYTRVDVVNKTKNFELVYRPQQPREIRIIGATNVIETGATLRHLAVVLDCARQLTPVVFPLAKREVMMSLPISEFSRIQRRGRVGRTGPGKYVGLYDREAKDNMFPTPPPSTLIGPTIPSSIYTILIIETLTQYREIAGDPGTLGKILSLKRIGCQLPRTDIVREIQLLSPISMDTSIHVMGKLTSLGLIEWDGSLSLIGLQAAAYKNMALAEVFLRVSLIDALIHPIEVDMLCRTLSDSIVRAELSTGIDWKPIVTRFYPAATFSFKDKPPYREDVLGIFQHVLACFEAVTNGSTLFDVPPHPKWGEFMVGEAKRVIFEALDAFPSRDIEGAFYAPLYADKNKEERAAFLRTCARALLQTNDRISGRRLEPVTEEGQATVL